MPPAVPDDPPGPALPGTASARRALLLLGETRPAPLRDHCLRSHLFAAAIAADQGLRPGHDYDAEPVFVICALQTTRRPRIAGVPAAPCTAPATTLAGELLRERHPSLPYRGPGALPAANGWGD